MYKVEQQLSGKFLFSFQDQDWQGLLLWVLSFNILFDFELIRLASNC
jgi:hypothetical protein